MFGENQPYIELCPYDDFSFLDDEEAFRELCSTLNFDAFDDSVTSDQILRRKRELNESTGDFFRIGPESATDFYAYQSDSATVCSSSSEDRSKSSSRDAMSSAPTLSNPTNSSKRSKSKQQHPSLEGGGVATPSSPASLTSQMSSATYNINNNNNNTTTTSTANTGSSSNNQGKKKTARLLIAKDDIRRQYAQIFADAFNSLDKTGLRALLYQYCYPHCVAVYKYIGNPNPLYGPMYCELVGVEAISNYWAAIFLSVPDSVYEVQETRLRALPNGSCAVVIKFIFSGTKVYRISADVHESVVYSDMSQQLHVTAADGERRGERRGGEGEGEEDRRMQQLMPSEVEFKDQVVGKDLATIGIDGCLPTSQSIALLGTLTFYTNADKYIYKMDVVYCIRG